MKKFFTLITMMCISALSAMAITTAELDQAVTDGTVLTFKVGDKYLYGSSAQNCAMGDATAAVSSSNAVVGFKVEKDDTGYLFCAIRPNGNPYELNWGNTNPCYLNSQPAGRDDVTFILGKDQDVTGGSVWTVEDGALKNVGSGKYFNGVKISATAVEVSIISIEDLKKLAEPEPEPDPIVIPESLKSFISNKTVFTLKSGDNYVYGPSQQNLAVGTWEQASATTNNANGYVLEADDYYFYLRAVKADGSNISAWGTNPCWLNNNGGNVVFNMGKDQDTKNGSSWILAEVSDGKYTIASVNQKGKYLAVNGTSGTLSETAVEWELFVPTTITVDNADFVSILNENSETVAAGLVAPGNYIIKPNSQEVGNYKFYQVKKNGTVIATASKDATYYMVELAAGDKIEVISQYPAATYNVTFSDPSAVKSAGTATQINGPVKGDAGYAFEYTLKDGYTANIASGFYLTQDTTITVTAPVQYATVTIDNPSKVKIISEENREGYTLVAGNQSFSAGQYNITPAHAGYIINNVTLNGETVAAPYGFYNVELAANDTLVITADYDPAEIKAQLAIANRKNIGECVKSVQHSGATEPQINGWFSGNFDIAAGYQMIVTLDEEKYQIDSVLVNDVKIAGSYGVYTVNVKGESIQFDIFGSALAVVNIDAPEMVKISNEEHAETTAKEVVYLPAGNYSIVPSEKAGAYKFYSVTQNGEVVANPAMMTIANGDTINVNVNYPVAYYTVTFSDPSAVKSAGTATQINGPVKGDAGYVFEYTLKDGYTANIASGFYLTQDTTITTEKLSNIIVAEGGTVGEISTITIKARKQGEMITASAQDAYVITLVNKATRETVYSWDAEAITAAEMVFDEETYMPVAVKLTVDPAITAAGTYDLVIPAGTFYVGEDMDNSDAAGTSFVIEGVAHGIELVSSEFTAEGGKLTFNQSIAFAGQAQEIKVNVAGVKTKNIATQATLTFDWDNWNVVNVAFADTLEAGDYTLDIPANVIIGSEEGSSSYLGGQIAFTVSSATGVKAITVNLGKDAKFIKNGKLVIVKAGKAYNANGAQMK